MTICCVCKQAYGTIAVIFDGVSNLPYAELVQGISHQNVASVVVERSVNALTDGEKAAFEVQVQFPSICFFTPGLPPTLQVSTAAADENTYDAVVRPISSISNGQIVYFRVALRPDAPGTCYPSSREEDNIQEAGSIIFSFIATQGCECQ